MRWLVLALSVSAILLSVWNMDRDRAGLRIDHLAGAGSTPVSLYMNQGDDPAPVVVVAHGFAGSRQLMEPIALTLAHAGYIVASYDLQGHGRNPIPMSGDVTSIEGTTRLLVNEARAVADVALAHPRADGRLVYLGHSMASDVVVRAALETPQANAVVAISMFSEALTPTAPANLLVITGQWEGRLAQEALKAVQLADPSAELGVTLGDPAMGTGRRAILAPSVEHVGVLYSATTLREAVAWLDQAFGRSSQSQIVLRGGWIALLLAGIIAFAWPLAQLLPRATKPRPSPLPTRVFWVGALVPAGVLPLLLMPVKVQVLPVLVADYLVLHLGLYGAAVLAVLAWSGQLKDKFPKNVWWIAGGIAFFGIIIFGTALDQYVASFFPQADRAVVICALMVGAVPFMLADAFLTQGGMAPWWRVLLVRSAFVASLLFAVALDFERLLFLLIILPIIVLFFALFGTMSGWVGRRTGLPAASGLGLGIVLAWSLGVTFPMFNSAG